MHKGGKTKSDLSLLDSVALVVAYVSVVCDRAGLLRISYCDRRYQLPFSTTYTFRNEYLKLEKK
eukprot:SAG31_NODE_1126_length_9767_cov_5.580058_3_plen_64_part_00